MLHVRGLSKVFTGEAGARMLFQQLSFDVAPGERLAVLGRNGQGKSTLLKILGGVLAPTNGAVSWSMSYSWPLGFTGGFQGGVTGLDNIRFIARVYDRPIERTIARVEEFAELGEHLYAPVKHYSSGMRARLAFGLSLAIEFDCYLIDEVIAVGDALFTEKCERELFEIRADRTFVIASHDMSYILQHCTRALIIERGRAKLFEDVGLAAEIYSSICGEHDNIAPRTLPIAPAQGHFG